ncbi:hypothetical protein LCGC14_2751300, partial [marine sediment metagenome]
YQSDRGIYTTGLQASLYGKVLDVDVKQTEDKSVVVDINGRVDLADVKAWSQQAALAFTTGETDFSAQIKVVAKGGRGGESEFTVKSDSVGIVIDLPAPYKKAAEQKHPFWLKLPIAKEKPLLRMGLEDTVELQLSLNAGTVESGLVLLDKAENTLHEKEFMVVVGAIDHFDYDQWQQVLQRYLEEDESMLAARRGQDNESVAAEKAGLSIKVRDLLLKDFSGFNQRYQNSKVNLQRWQDAWLLSVNNDSIRGELFIPNDMSAASPLIAKLQRLTLPENSVAEGMDSTDLDTIGQINLDADIQNLFILY